MTPAQFHEVAQFVPYRNKGMFYSEIFAFLRACQQQSVDLILESGVKFGMSTKMMSVAWAGEIVAIDRDASYLETSVAGVRFLHGDSRLLIPWFLRKADVRVPPRRVGVLIDGPKGSSALELKDVSLGFSSCRVVGVHDVGARAGQSSHTHDVSFAGLRELLDRQVPDHWRRKYPLGPGLGLWEKNL